MPTPAATTGKAMRVLGRLVRDVIARNPRTFRVMGPAETAPNRLTGRHGLFNCYGGVHPHHRLDVQPAREVG